MNKVGREMKGFSFYNSVYCKYRRPYILKRSKERKNYTAEPMKGGI